MEKTSGKLNEAPERVQPVKFSLVKPGLDLEILWPLVVDYLTAALVQSMQHEWTPEEMRERIERGEFILALVARGNEVIGGQVFNIATDPQGRKYVAIMCSGGRDMWEWLPGMVSLGKHLALMAGAERVVVVGRRGWARVLRRYGLKVNAVVAAARIEDIDALPFHQIVGEFKG
jgi:hypothetical protein